MIISVWLVWSSILSLRFAATLYTRYPDAFCAPPPFPTHYKALAEELQLSQEREFREKLEKKRQDAQAVAGRFLKRHAGHDDHSHQVGQRVNRKIGDLATARPVLSSAALSTFDIPPASAASS
jgi:hypothetical protein